MAIGEPVTYDELLTLLRRLTLSLEHISPFLVIGGLAVNLHLAFNPPISGSRSFRSTQDIDILVPHGQASFVRAALVERLSEFVVRLSLGGVAMKSVNLGSSRIVPLEILEAGQFTLPPTLDRRVEYQLEDDEGNPIPSEASCNRLQLKGIDLSFQSMSSRQHI